MKTIKKLIRKFRSKTPVYVKCIQATSGAIAGTMIAYDSWPVVFKQLTPETAKSIMLVSLVLIFITQFIEKKNEA